MVLIENVLHVDAHKLIEVFRVCDHRVQIQVERRRVLAQEAFGQYKEETQLVNDEGQPRERDRVSQSVGEVQQIYKTLLRDQLVL